jgi:hypothetical protein
MFSIDTTRFSRNMAETARGSSADARSLTIVAVWD